MGRFIGLGFGVAATILIGLYVGKKTNHMVAGIIMGVVFAFFYLYKVLIQDDKKIQKGRNRNHKR